MTEDEMYALLKRRSDATNWNSNRSVTAYIEYARALRARVEADHEEIAWEDQADRLEAEVGEAEADLQNWLDTGLE